MTTESSSDAHQSKFEPCVLGKAKVWLPVELILDTSVFNEVISLDTWENVLSDEEKEKLKKLLPAFPDNNVEEQQITLQKLFSGENFCFGNHVQQLQQDLLSGEYHPDVAGKQKVWKKLQARECHQQNTHRLQDMLPEVLIKRQELLEAVHFTAPHEYVKYAKTTPEPFKKCQEVQAANKYNKLLEDLKQELGEPISSDDEYHNGAISDSEDEMQSPWEDNMQHYFDSPRQQTLSTEAINPPAVSLLSLKQLTMELKPLDMQEDTATSQPFKQTSASPPHTITEKDYMKMLERMQIIKEDSVEHTEFSVNHIHLCDVIARTYPVRKKKEEELEDELTLKRKRKREKEELRLQKKKRMQSPNIKEEQVLPAAHSDPSIIVDVPSSSESSLTIQNEDFLPSRAESPVQSPELHSKVQFQVPHSFFALLRNYFVTPMTHQMMLSDLREKVRMWEKSPISALCPWVPLQSSWSKVVENTLHFLSLEEQGCVVQYDMDNDMWAWKGDPKVIANEELTKLFKRWLDLVLRFSCAQTPSPSKDQAGVPEPRVRTEYTVRPSTAEEVELFREQELQRFTEPHKPFSYHLHGYKSVVSAVKGITSRDPVQSKGREHSLLVSDRPFYVTILSLVRDAVARLPNGEGTRLEICQLLKESQYIAACSTDNQIHAAVSGALDRLHNEHDPSVKYDSNMKLWIYMHRNRTETDFERIQQEQRIANKNKKSSHKKMRNPNSGSPTPGATQSDFSQSSSGTNSPIFDSLSQKSSPGKMSLGSNSPRSSSAVSPRAGGGGENMKGIPHRSVTMQALSFTAQQKLQTVTLQEHGISEANNFSVLDGTGKVVTPASTKQRSMDPSLSTIQSLISESLIKSQLLHRQPQRSKTPPASIGGTPRIMDLSPFQGPVTLKTQLVGEGIQPSLSFPAVIPHSSCNIAGDLFKPGDFLVAENLVNCSKTAVSEGGSFKKLKKLVSAETAKIGFTSEVNVSQSNQFQKTSGTLKKLPLSDKKGSQSSRPSAKSKGEKSKSSKSSGGDKRSQTIQLKSGTITVTLPSSALKGQTVRSILANAANITIAKSSGSLEEQTPQPPKKSSVEKKQQAVRKVTKLPDGGAQRGLTAVPVQAEKTGKVNPLMISQRVATTLPTIIFRPTNTGMIQQTTKVGQKSGTVGCNSVRGQAVATTVVGSKGGISGATGTHTVSSKQPAMPISLVMSGNQGKTLGTTSKSAMPIIPGSLLPGNISLPGLGAGQNIILQMPDGSKFVTSLPVTGATNVQGTPKGVPASIRSTSSQNIVVNPSSVKMSTPILHGQVSSSESLLHSAPRCQDSSTMISSIPMTATVSANGKLKMTASEGTTTITSGNSSAMVTSDLTGSFPVAKIVTLARTTLNKNESTSRAATIQTGYILGGPLIKTSGTQSLLKSHVVSNMTKEQHPKNLLFSGKPSSHLQSSKPLPNILKSSHFSEARRNTQASSLIRVTPVTGITSKVVPSTGVSVQHSSSSSNKGAIVSQVASSMTTYTQSTKVKETVPKYSTSVRTMPPNLPTILKSSNSSGTKRSSTEYLKTSFLSKAIYLTGNENISTNTTTTSLSSVQSAVCKLRESSTSPTLLNPAQATPSQNLPNLADTFSITKTSLSSTAAPAPQGKAGAPSGKAPGSPGRVSLPPIRAPSSPGRGHPSSRVASPARVSSPVKSHPSSPNKINPVRTGISRPLSKSPVRSFSSNAPTSPMPPSPYDFDEDEPTGIDVGASIKAGKKTTTNRNQERDKSPGRADPQRVNKSNPVSSETQEISLLKTAKSLPEPLIEMSYSVCGGSSQLYHRKSIQPNTSVKGMPERNPSGNTMPAKPVSTLTSIKDSLQANLDSGDGTGDVITGIHDSSSTIISSQLEQGSSKIAGDEKRT